MFESLISLQNTLHLFSELSYFAYFVIILVFELFDSRIVSLSFLYITYALIGSSQTIYTFDILRGSLQRFLKIIYRFFRLIIQLQHSQHCQHLPTLVPFPVQFHHYFFTFFAVVGDDLSH